MCIRDSIYVANDSTSATFYRNQKDGTFKDEAIESGIAFSPDGKPQAGMGVSIGDFNRDGWLDIVKTNFAGDTDSLYANLGDGNFEDQTYRSGLGINTRYLGWGVGFFDPDNDGWLDILICNGHVYPEVEASQIEAPYAERKYLYRNLRNGQFEDVTAVSYTHLDVYKRQPLAVSVITIFAFGIRAPVASVTVP